MRTITSQEISLLRAPHRLQVWPRLLVYHGTYRKDISERLKYASIDFDPSTGTHQLTLQLKNEDGLLSPGVMASPFNQEDGIYAPLFSPFREVEYWEAYTELGQRPQESDYKWLFHGFLSDQFEFPSRTPHPNITLKDAFSERAMAAQIIEGKDYDGIAEAIIQQLLSDYGLSTPGLEPDFTLWTPVASEYLIPDSSPYQPMGVNLFEAIQAVARGRGWIVAYRFKEDIGKWRPCFYYPDYHRPALADFSITTEDLEDDIDSLSGANIRNVVRVSLADKTEVTRKNEGSIERYSPKKRDGSLDRIERFMSIVEDSSSPLNTLAEADRLARIILHETAYLRGTRTLNFSSPMWHLEWGDLIGIANPSLCDSSPIYLIHQVTHTTQVDEGGVSCQAKVTAVQYEVMSPVIPGVIAAPENMEGAIKWRIRFAPYGAVLICRYARLTWDPFEAPVNSKLILQQKVEGGQFENVREVNEPDFGIDYEPATKGIPISFRLWCKSENGEGSSNEVNLTIRRDTRIW